MNKQSNRLTVIIAIATITDFQQTDGTVSPLAELFDVGTMERALKKHIQISIAEIEDAFKTNSELPIINDSYEYEVELVQEITGSSDHLFDKAQQLTRLYISSTITNHAVKQMIICNIGYLLFSREAWFEKNLVFAQKIFQRNQFDVKFFSARCGAAVLYTKKSII